MFTWDELRGLQRRSAEWVEEWVAEGVEVLAVVEEDNRQRRVHLAWFTDPRVAQLVVDQHNVSMFLMNALWMYRQQERDYKPTAQEGNDNGDA